MPAARPEGSQDQEQEPQEEEGEAWQEQHVAAMSGQRARLQELEQSVAQIKQTLALAGSEGGEKEEEEPAEVARREHERTTSLIQEQELSLQRKQQ